MLLIIAWKNIWRNKVRSLVVITAVMLGLWAGAFILAYSFGMIEQRLNDAIGYEISHLQFHHPEYGKDHDPGFFMQNSHKIAENVRSDEAVKAVTSRSLAYGMINSPTNGTGGKFIGIHPEEEDEVTNLKSFISEGEFLEAGDHNKLLIGKKLADRLKVKIRSKVVLTFQDREGTIVAGAFRIKGIFETYNSSMEDRNLYIPFDDLSKLAGSNGDAYEIAVILNNSEHLDTYLEKLRTEYPGFLVESWKELSPELSLMIESLDQYMIIFLVIILLALSFGIVNTMLMAVLERVREIGMLMAIGMNKIKLFTMISLETIFLVLIAAPLGLFLAYLSISYLGEHGMDLSGIYQEAYAEFGFKMFIYPKLEGIYYLRIMGLVIVTAILASIYPAITALKLDPVTAIRKI